MRKTVLSALSLGAALVALPALAQETTMGPPPGAPVPATAPDGRPPADVATTTNAPVGERGPGVDSANAVNPAPGAQGPYVGHPNAFYETQARVDRVEQRIRSELTGAKQRKALSGIRSIRSEIATQKARHGEMRDWDREHVNRQLDQLEAQYRLRAAVAAN